jgi:hypothetical protein
MVIPAKIEVKSFDRCYFMTVDKYRSHDLPLIASIFATNYPVESGVNQNTFYQTLLIF